MLTIGILITACSASAAPHGTVIKGGVLTYPAGPYISKDPLLLSLENYTGNNNTQTLAEPLEIIYPEKEYLFCGHFESNKEILYPSFAFLSILLLHISTRHSYSLHSMLHLSSHFNYKMDGSNCSHQSFVNLTRIQLVKIKRISNRAFQFLTKTKV